MNFNLNCRSKTRSHLKGSRAQRDKYFEILFTLTYIHQIIYGRKLLWQHSRSELELDELNPRQHLPIRTSVRIKLIFIV